MRTDRLLKLADYLETIPAKQFNMAFLSNGMASHCEFAGCAIGWAIHGKLFRGLTYDIKNELTSYYGTVGSFGVDKLFGGEVWYDLFSEDKPGTPHQVATRIREFVRDH